MRSAPEDKDVDSASDTGFRFQSTGMSWGLSVKPHACFKLPYCDSHMGSEPHTDVVVALPRFPLNQGYDQASKNDMSGNPGP